MTVGEQTSETENAVDQRQVARLRDIEIVTSVLGWHRDDWEDHVDWRDADGQLRGTVWQSDPMHWPVPDFTDSPADWQMIVDALIERGYDIQFGYNRRAEFNIKKGWWAQAYEPVQESFLVQVHERATLEDAVCDVARAVVRAEPLKASGRPSTGKFSGQYEVVGDVELTPEEERVAREMIWQAEEERKGFNSRPLPSA